MPAKSQKQLKYIYFLRNKYGSKEKAPEKYKWVFDSDWISDVDYDKLPKKSENNMIYNKSYKKFFNIKTQINLDNDFKEILDEVTIEIGKNKPYKKRFKVKEIITSSDFPQSVRPEQSIKVVKKDDEVEEDFLRNKDDKKEILDVDINVKSIKKNKLIDEVDEDEVEESKYDFWTV